jgi:hypothetical protein
VHLAKSFSLVGSVNIFSAGYTETNVSNSWAASLNSPFKFDNFSLGFHVTF